MIFQQFSNGVFMHSVFHYDSERLMLIPIKTCNNFSEINLFTGVNLLTT